MLLELPIRVQESAWVELLGAAQVAIVKEMTGRNRAAQLGIVKQMSRQ